jgi:hypothetical protein
MQMASSSLRRNGLHMHAFVLAGLAHVLPVNNTRTGNNLHAENCDGAAEMFADIVYMIFSLPLGLLRLSNTTLQ